jgi:hypothetical protein
VNYTSMTSEVKSRPRILQCAIEALRSRAVISSFESEFCICRGRRKRPLPGWRIPSGSSESDVALRDSQRKLVEEAHAEYLDRLTNAWKGNRSTDA